MSRPLTVAALSLALISASLGAQTWINVGPGGVANGVRDIAIDPANAATVYAAASYDYFGPPTTAGLFRTLDGGSTWQQVLGGRDCMAVAIDTSRAGTIYAGTSAGLFRSTDGGGVWALVSSLVSETISSVAVASDGAIYAGAESGVWKSADAGVTWQATGSGTPLPFASHLAFDPRSPAMAYATAPGGVYKTIDAAAHWALVLAEPSYVNWRTVALDPGNGATAYAALNDLLFQTRDGGSTWTPLPLSSPGTVFTAIAVDPVASNIVYTSSPDLGILRSPDFGTTWFPVSNFIAWIYSFAFDSSPEKRLYGGSDAGVIYRAETASLPYTCSASATSLCLLAGRFQVVAQVGPVGAGYATGATALTGRSGGLWFFTPSNIDVGVKVLDGRSVNGHFWVFFGALSNVEYRITVTDTLTGVVKSYTNPPNSLTSVADLGAF
jgi:photosystem II stability/assembly factor-like uncharacterized protein